MPSGSSLMCITKLHMASCMHGLQSLLNTAGLTRHAQLQARQAIKR